MKLYDYFRSSASYRVRIALNLKGVAYERREVHLVQDGGQHLTAAYRAVNPQARVPSLEVEDGAILTQSPAILEWIEETWALPPLLPRDPIARAHVRAVASIVCCDIHPLNNLSTLGRLRSQFGADDEAVNDWYAHWVTEGFKAIEALIEGGAYCFGTSPTLADVVLMPQIYNGRRFKVPLDAFPKILGVEAHCAALPAFAKAHPDTVSQGA